MDPDGDGADNAGDRDAKQQQQQQRAGGGATAFSSFFAAAPTSAAQFRRRRPLSTCTLLLLVACVVGAVVFAVHWRWIRCPHDAVGGCADVCDDAATSQAVRLIHHEMPTFVELESRYVQLQSKLGLRTAVTGRQRLVSSQVCPSGVSLATPFLAALTPKVHLLVECLWDCRTVLAAEEPFHIGGPRPGTAGLFEGTQSDTAFRKMKQARPPPAAVEVEGAPRRFCAEYKSYVVQLAVAGRDDAALAQREQRQSKVAWQTVHRLEELVNLFAPIATPEEALSFAAAATWGEPSFQTQLLPWSEYVVDQLEDTHVEVIVRKKGRRPVNSEGDPTDDSAHATHPDGTGGGVPPLRTAAAAADPYAAAAAASEIVYFLINLYSREGGPCPGRGRLWEHKVKVFPNGTIAEKVTLVAKPCHHQTCVEHDPLTAPLPPAPKQFYDPSKRRYRRGDPPKRQEL